MSHKKRQYKVTPFSPKASPEKMRCEIHRVLQLLQSERITFERAHEMLHQGTKDIQVIYYDVSASLERAKYEVSKLRSKGPFDGRQLQSESVLSLNTVRAIRAMRTALGAFKKGGMSKRQLRRQARVMKDLLDRDAMTLNREIQGYD